MISSPLLPQIGACIDGQWTPASGKNALRVINPATGELLAEAPAAGATQTMAAIEAAGRFVADAPRPLDERRAFLRGIVDGLLEAKNELARIITLENGKPLKESVAEVEYSAGFFRVCAENIEHLKPHTLPEPIRDCRWTIHHRPARVAGLITPWNFPLAMLAKKFSAAIGAGCGIVIKPASQTPLSAMALCHIAERAGVPAGMVNLVAGPPGPIAKVLCEHPAVRIISFTGSTAVGKQLMAAVAPHVKRLALELGGNAPFIVLDDADLAAAADGLMANKFRAGGQTCVCANRVYVQRGIHDAFLEAVAERVRKLKVGDGLQPGVDIGPLINRDAFDKVSAHVQDAIDRGAKLITGGQARRPEHDWGAFYPPTVLAGMTPEMLVCREETFGPVIPVSTFDDEEAVLAEANGTPYGLAAYVYTRDRERAERVAARMVFGHVGVNTGSGPTPEAPFGGMKQSGFGREGGLDGLLEFTETQTVAIGI